MFVRSVLFVAGILVLGACTTFVVNVDDVERIVGNFYLKSGHWRVIERFKKINYFAWESDSYDYEDYEYLLVHEDGRSINLADSIFFKTSEGWSKTTFSSPLYAHNDFHILACGDALIAINRRVYPEEYDHNSDCEIEDRKTYIGDFVEEESRFYFESYITSIAGTENICSAKRVVFCE